MRTKKDLIRDYEEAQRRKIMAFEFYSDQDQEYKLYNLRLDRKAGEIWTLSDAGKCSVDLDPDFSFDEHLQALAEKVCEQDNVY